MREVVRNVSVDSVTPVALCTGSEAPHLATQIVLQAGDGEIANTDIVFFRWVDVVNEVAPYTLDKTNCQVISIGGSGVLAMPHGRGIDGFNPFHYYILAKSGTQVIKATMTYSDKD